VSDAARPLPLSRLDYRIEAGRVFLDDGRTYPATALEEELYGLLGEAAAEIVRLRGGTAPVGWGRPIDGDLEETAEELGVEPRKGGVA
jgi:hypothetical protein